MYKIKNKILLSIHCNVSNGFLFVNSTTMSKFKAKNSEKKEKTYPLCLGYISKCFTVNKMNPPPPPSKTGLNGYVYDFFVDYDITDISNIINIGKYLMKKQKAK